MSANLLPIWGEHAARSLKLDCRHYRGDRPCSEGIQGVCPTACEQYNPMGHRILIIKLGALGDVIRTAALLPSLKEEWPKSHITWVTRPGGVRMLANHPLIDRLVPFDTETLCHLEYERFDLCLSLDKEPAPAALGMRVDAPDRRGIGLSSFGTPYPLNRECADYFRLGLDDEAKFRGNQKSYPQLIHEALGLPYRGQSYRLYPGARERELAARVWRSLGVGGDEIVIGLNTGAGHVFANKSWRASKFAQLAEMVRARFGWRAALLGGADEASTNAGIATACPDIVDTGGDHDELTFTAVVERCNVVVTGDTMALHVAIARRVPVVALFGPTCAQEIDLFGCGSKVRTGLACSPCYRRTCDESPNCMDDIDIERVLTEVERWAAGASEMRRGSLPILEASR